jgi:hypothetical protein
MTLHLKSIVSAKPDNLEILHNYFVEHFVLDNNVYNFQITITNTNFIERYLYSCLYKTLINIINGIICVITRTIIDFDFLNLTATKDNGEVVRFPPLPADRYYRDYYPSQIHSKNNASVILLASLNDEDLQIVFILFSHPYTSWSWNNFYVIWEIIQNSVIIKFSIIFPDKTKAKRKVICEKLGIKYEEIDDFCNMANSASNPQHGMRHYSSNKPSIPISIGFGFELIREVIIQWLQLCYDFNISTAVPDLPKGTKIITEKEEYKQLRNQQRNKT